MVCALSRSHVTFGWVISRMNESRDMWMSHMTCEWVMSHMNESCHIWISHVTYEWIMSHTNASMSHMNESCHIWMRQCHIWVMSWAMCNKATSHVTHIIKSCHTYESVTSYICADHAVRVRGHTKSWAQEHLKIYTWAPRNMNIRILIHNCWSRSTSSWAHEVMGTWVSTNIHMSASKYEHTHTHT